MLETVTNRKQDLNQVQNHPTTSEKDEVLELLNRLEEIYCENDFLIKKNKVELLVLQYQHLKITRNIIAEKSKKVIHFLKTGKRQNQCVLS